MALPSTGTPPIPAVGTSCQAVIQMRALILGLVRISLRRNKRAALMRKRQKVRIPVATFGFLFLSFLSISSHRVDGRGSGFRVLVIARAVLSSRQTLERQGRFCSSG